MTERRAAGTGSIFQLPSGLWRATLPSPPVEGKRRRLTKTSKDRRVVERWLTVRVDERERRDAVFSTWLDGSGQVTVAEWFRYWLTTSVVPQVRPKTADGYRSTVESAIIPLLGASTPIGSLRASDIRRAHAKHGETHSATTVKNLHVILSRGLDAAVREEELPRNPARLVEPPRPARPALDVPSLDEVRELLAFLPDHQHGVRWMTSILTGARRGEVGGLEVDRVSTHIEISWQLQTLRRDPNGRLIAPPDFDYRHLYGGYYLTRPKSQAGWRIVPMIEPLRSLMRTHLETMQPNPWGLVFTKRGRPIDPDWETKEWRRFSEDYFGPGRHVRLHDLRHATVDLLYEAELPEDLIIEIVGHSTRSMSRSYKSPSRVARLTRAMRRAEEVLNDRTTPDRPDMS